MRDALNATGRPIYYSIHGPKLVPAIANLWRTTGDIDNNWGSIVQRAIWNSEAYASNREAVHAGAFNGGPPACLSGATAGLTSADPDMLEVGNLWGPLGDAEGRSHFSMWSVMKAPLLIGTDVTNMTAETLNTLTHEGVIAINQDPLAVQATLLPPPPAEAGAPPPPPGTNATQLTWAGPLAKGSYVALLVNNREVPQTLEFDTTALGGGPFAVTELWTGVKVKFGRTLKLPDVGGHDCALLRFDPKTAP